MTPEEMKRLHDEHLAAEERQDIEAVMRTYSDDCYHETAAIGLRFTGKTAIRFQYESFWTAFPDAAPTQVQEAFGDNFLMDRGMFNATLLGPLYGLPATGKRVSLPFARTVLFQDGLIHAEIGYADFASLCDQAELPLMEALAMARALAASQRVAPVVP